MRQSNEPTLEIDEQYSKHIVVRSPSRPSTPVQREAPAPFPTSHAFFKAKNVEKIEKTQSIKCGCSMM